MKQKILSVKDYGQKRKFEKLINAKWTADEYDAWEMTAIAIYLLKAKGAYRVPLNEALFHLCYSKKLLLQTQQKQIDQRTKREYNRGLAKWGQ